MGPTIQEAGPMGLSDIHVYVSKLKKPNLKGRVTGILPTFPHHPHPGSLRQGEYGGL